jgi:trimeric autotransporter adhesin
MAMNVHMKKWVSGVALASVIWTGTVWTTAGVYAAASPFNDVKAGHWAEKHISKLALQGILKGGTGGKFNPNNAVSREEAVIIALRFMGIDDQATTSQVIVLPGSLQIKEDYKKYLNLAFQKKLLLLDEEVALASKETGKAWGKSPASREWVTRLLVRAVGKEADAKEMAAEATSFSDNANIDAKLVGYVNVAVASGLVKGVTAAKFDPKAAVTRATVSTLFSRAEPKLPVAYAGQVTGVLLSISADQLSVLHQDGSIRDYTITPDTRIYRFDSENMSSLAGLKQYAEAVLISNGDGSIGYVEQLNDTPKVKIHEGTLTRITESMNRLTVLIGEDYMPFTYDPQHPPVVTDSNGQTIALKDLPVNVDVKVMVDSVRTEGKIVAVNVKQSVINKTASGSVAAWNAASRTLQVKDAATGSTENLTVSANAVIKQNGLPTDEVKVGDTITYEIKAGLVTSIVITKTEQAAISGKLVNASKSDKTIQFSINNKLQAEYLADNAAVTIQGLSDATIDDLQKDDAVTLTFDANGKVNLVTVTNRTVQTMNSAVVAGYVAETKTLSLIDASGKARNLFLGSNVRYELNGTALPAESALPLITVKGKKLNVSFTGENAVVVSIVAKYSGTVVENNTTAKTLKIMPAAGNVITLQYQTPTVEIYGQNSETYNDVRVGDQVTVVLNANQDQAATIQVQKNAQFEVVSVDTAGSKIRVKRNDGTVEDWSVTSSLALQDENGSTISLSSVTAGSIINATLQGNTAVKIKKVSVVYGRVSSVNTGAASLDIVTPSGASVTKAVGTSPLITRDNVVLNSLTAVQPDDRVEVRKDENDRTVIQIVSVLRKVVWFYDNSSRTLNVLHELSDTNFSFTLHPEVYIHQGTTPLTISNLQNGDAISIYLLRGKVVEIAK